MKQSIVLLALMFFSHFCFAQIYTVTSLADDGSAGTLRDAIVKVNAGTNNIINFNFAPGAAPYTIVLLSDLPTLTPPGAVQINGYSEPASFAGLIGSRVISVEINGNGTANNGFDINAANITISGLAIYKCIQNGINIHAGIGNTTIWGNFIGTNATGVATSLGNGNAGIRIGASGTATNATTIGTDGNGTSDASEGNLIISNGAGGVFDGGIVGLNVTNSRIAGNYIGLGSDGSSTTNLFNFGPGIVLYDQSTGNTIGTNGDGISDGLERNYISNNVKSGIWLNSKSDFNVIAGNAIGLNTSGGQAKNFSSGILIDNCANNRIGTNADAVSDALEDNFISYNGGEGIFIKSGNLGGAFDENANNNLIAGNSIGVALDNTTAAGNGGTGIRLSALTTFTVANNIIGSNGNGTNESVKGNIIANQTGFDGILLEDVSNTNLVIGNRISRNSIYNNGVAAVELANAGSIGTTGITPNQAGGFSATGPNNLLNAPVITSVTNPDPHHITFNGFSRPGAILEFYISDKMSTSPAPPAGLTKNFGQGKTFLFQAKQGGTLNGITDIGSNTAGSYTTADQGTSSGATPITTDFTFSFNVNNSSIGVGPGTYGFTASAIDAGNTSGNVNNTSLSGETTDGNLVTLPITLLDFSAHVSEGAVVLQWSTSSESQNNYFDIERSADGATFTSVGRVNGHLSSTVVNSYSFTDGQPLPGHSFYRLRQVDIDGKGTYSRIVALHIDLAANAIKLFPSPFIDYLNISINSPSDDQLTVRIIDQSGKVVITNPYSVTKGVNSFNLNRGLPALTRGVYIIEISGKILNYSQKLIKK